MLITEEVLSAHFMTLRRTPFPHVLIEQRLLAMGGSGPDGMSYRKQVLAAAGWGYDGLTPFAKHPDLAAKAFNRIREVLEENSSKDSLLAALGS